MKLLLTVLLSLVGVARATTVCSPQIFYQYETGALLSPLHILIFQDVHKTLAQVAKTWTWAADRKSVVIELDTTQNFHSNKFFTPKKKLVPEDVVFTLERQLEPAMDNTRDKTTRVAFRLALDPYFAGVKKVSESALQINFKVPFPAKQEFLFAHPMFSILSREYYDYAAYFKKFAYWESHPIGLGEWSWASFDGQMIELHGVKTGEIKRWQLQINEAFFRKALLSGACDSFRFVPQFWTTLITGHKYRVSKEAKRSRVYFLNNLDVSRYTMKQFNQAIDQTLFSEAMKGQAIEYADKMALYRGLPNYVKLRSELKDLPKNGQGFLVPGFREPGEIQHTGVVRGLKDQFTKLGLRILPDLIKPDLWHRLINQRQFDLALYSVHEEWVEQRLSLCETNSWSWVMAPCQREPEQTLKLFEVTYFQMAKP